MVSCFFFSMGKNSKKLLTAIGLILPDSHRQVVAWLQPGRFLPIFYRLSLLDNLSLAGYIYFYYFQRLN